MSENEENEGITKRKIAAIIGNSANQIGITMFDEERSLISLLTINDTRQFHLTLDFINKNKLSMIIFPHSHTSKQRMCLEIKEKCTSVAYQVVPRSKFNEDVGLTKLLALFEGNDNCSLVRRDIVNDYLARASFSALFFYMKVSEGFCFESNSSSLRIKKISPQDTLKYTENTIKDLELITNKDTRRQEGSLFYLLNFMVTKQGKKLLRQEILSPTSSIKVIKERRETVNKYQNYEKDEIRTLLESNLEELHDIDVLTNFYSKNINKYSLNLLYREINNALRLSEVLHNLLSISKALKKFDILKSKIISEVVSTIDRAQESFSKIINVVSSKIEKGSMYQNKAEQRKKQSLFAVKMNIDGFLDVARCTYNVTLKEIKSLVASYQTRLPDIGLDLVWTATRGYHLKYQKESLKQQQKANHSLLHTQRNLSKHISFHNGIKFVRKQELTSTVRCTTEELYNLTERLKLAEREILERTTKQIVEIKEEIRETNLLKHLFNCADQIAILDLISCISEATECFNQWTFAKLPSSNDIEIDEASEENKIEASCTQVLLTNFVHPFMYLAQKSGKQNFVNFMSNSISLDIQSQKLAFIMGPNCVGKSTVLKAISLFVIMNQIGFPIPAEAASLPIFGSIHARIGTEDDLEGNASTFSVEMSDIARTLDCLQQDRLQKNCLPSLVVVDELGRGTEPIEGAAIAWACLEELIKANAIILFVTHFSELSVIPKQVPHLVKLFNFVIELNLSHSETDSVDGNETEDEIKAFLNFESTHKLKEIQWEEPLSQDIPYGIKTAYDCSMPKNIILDALKYREDLSNKLIDNKKTEEVIVEDLSKGQLNSYNKLLEYSLQVQNNISLEKYNEKLLEVKKRKNLVDSDTLLKVN